MDYKKISDRITSNKTKHFLIENELTKLSNFDAAYFRAKNYFDDDGIPNYLDFQSKSRCFEKNIKTKNISHGNLKDYLLMLLNLLL